MRRATVGAIVVLGASACLSSANLSGAPENDAAPACTADVQNDVGNCGACGRVCPNHANAYALCKDGQCGLGCDTGFADCNATRDDGCETTLAADAEHCGRCGHSCAGGRCVDGKCQPVVLATLRGQFSSLAIDETHLFCGFYAGDTPSNAGRIVRFERDGKMQVDVVTGLPFSPPSLATDATRVYFARPSTDVTLPNGAVLRAPKTGGAAQMLADKQNTSEGPFGGGTGAAVPFGDGIGGGARIRVSGGFVYWLVAGGFDTNGNPKPGALRRCSTETCTATDVAAGVRTAVDFDLDDATVFFVTQGFYEGNSVVGRGAYRCLASGCIAAGPTPLSSVPPGISLLSIAEDAEHVFIGTAGSIARLRKPDNDYASVTTTGGSPTDMVSDGTTLYWIESTSLLSCPTAGCPGGPLVVELRSNPVGLAIDATSVYVAANAGENSVLYRIAR